MTDLVTFVIQSIFEAFLTSAKNLKSLSKKLLFSFLFLEVLIIIFSKNMSQFTLGTLITVGICMVIFIVGYFYY